MQLLKKYQLNNMQAHILKYAIKNITFDVVKSYNCDVAIIYNGVVIPLRCFAYSTTTSKQLTKATNTTTKQRREAVAKLKKSRLYNAFNETITAGGWYACDNIERATDEQTIKTIKACYKILTA